MMIINVVVKLFVLSILGAVVGTVCVTWLNQRLSDTMSKNYQDGYKLPEDFVRSARQRSLMIAKATKLEQLRRLKAAQDELLELDDEDAVAAIETGNESFAVNG
ncbi:MAG: hypothetical protein KDD66_13400 [Bdellovibrionales bacterium]|nr:hypothetical protein [Bdellovibrionales bacterium]